MTLTGLKTVSEKLPLADVAFFMVGLERSSNSGDYDYFLIINYYYFGQ